MKKLLISSLGFFIICNTFFFCNNAFGQASVISGSIATSKTSYTPGAGSNRMIVVSVSGRRNAGVGTITSVTWNGQSFTNVVSQNGSTTIRTEIWYLNEAGIRAGGYCTTSNIVVTWSTAPTNELFTGFTLKDVDQTTPIPAGTSTGTGVNAGATTTATLSGITTAGANDLVVYSSASDNNRTHTPPSGYTEQTDNVVLTPNLTLATATKAITGSGTEAPIATWVTGNSLIVMAGVVFNGLAAVASSPVTYYSLTSGDWDASSSWSLSADGSTGAASTWPGRTDNVVIRSGHTILINSTDDNKTCGITPDGLLRSNVGPFAASNLVMFYQTGDVLINGTLNVTGIEMMTEGYTKIVSGGLFSLSSSYLNLGYLEADASSSLTAADDLILAGNSTTIINTSSISNDDLIISFTNATLCGTGTTTLRNGSGSVITYANSATINQICTTFTVACTGVGCTGFPAVGTTLASLGNSGPAGVASTDGTSELKVWLDAGKNVFSNAGTIPATNGSGVQQWSDRSGSTNNATRATTPPTYTLVNSAINNMPSIDFAALNTNILNLNSFTLNPATSSFSIISVLSSNTSLALQQNILQQKNGTGLGRTFFLYDNVGTKMSSFLGGVLTAPTATYSSSAWTILSHTYKLSGGTTAINLYDKGNADGSGTVTPESADGAWLIGASKTELLNFFNGSMSEILILNQAINQARRIIIENYLSAKYNVALTTNNVYTMDDGTGVYDYEVAGIGQASDGSNHKDARGTGIVRMWNPNGLANNEFMMWGHDNAALNSVTSTAGTTVDGTIIQERLLRVWRAGEQGDVGTTSISFDISSLGLPLGSNLRLLVDRDGDGFQDNDVTPASGSFVNNTVVFSGVNLQNGDRFTLGNTNKALSLPIELISFSAKAQAQSVLLNWSTATELNNDFFTIERTVDGEKFDEVSTVKGHGTTTSKMDYQFTDNDPLPGISYYRLRQTDFDNRVTYSEIRKVEFTGSRISFKVYPNPAIDHKFDFELTNMEQDSEVPVKILNAVGLPVFQAVYKADGTGKIKATVDLGTVSGGIYIVYVNAATGLRERIIIP